MSKICDVIEILAIQLYPIGKWPSILESVAGLLSSNNGEDVIICSTYLLGLITQACFKTIDKQVQMVIVQQITNLFQKPSLEIRLSALKALERVLSIIEEENPIPANPLVFFEMLGNADQHQAQQILECLTEIIKCHSELFVNHLTQIQTMMSQLAMQKQLEADTRTLALELLVTLAETDPQAVRRDKGGQYLCTTLDVALRMMVELEHDHEDWNTSNEKTEDESFDSANDALTRLAEAIGAPKFAGPCMQRIEQLLQSNEWSYKHSGLCALAQVMEVFKKKKIPARTVMKKIVPFLNDDHPRVRYQAVSCIALMCTDFGSKFVAKNAKLILDSIFALLCDKQNPRMNVHGTNCLVNFCEKASTRCLKKWLKSIMENLLELAKRTNIGFVQEGLLNALAEVADHARNKFEDYYPTFSEYVMQILKSDTKDELKVEAFRCLSFFGRAVGVKLFSQHACQSLQISQQFVKQDADILMLLRCWGRVAETLGEQFQPYLEAVAQEALKYAKQDCVLKNYDSDDDDHHVEMVLQNEKTIALDSNLLQEKEGGLEFLGTLASSCPNSFQPLLQTSVGICAPFISYPLSSSIRSAALESLKGFAECAIFNFQKHPQQSKDFFLGSLDQLCCRLQEEKEETKVLSEVAHVISKLLSQNQEFTKHVLTEEIVAKVVRSLISCVRQMNERVNMRNVAMLAPDLDPEDAEDFNEENKKESYVSQDITDALDSLLKIYKAALLPLFQELMEDFNWMIGNDSHPIQRYTVLRIFCYIFENCDASATTDLLKALDRFIECMDDESCDVRQAAVYALGLVSEQTASFQPYVNPVLQKCFGHFEKQLDEAAYESVLDNSTSTIGKILKHHANSVSNKQEAYLLWLTKCFPMREDAQEAQWCYDRFCELLEEKNPDFLGSNMCNVPLIVKTMIDGYGSQLMSEESESYFKNMLEGFKKSDDNVVKQLINNAVF